MHYIKHRIVVFSGKGGVGKTTVSVNLAYEKYNYSAGMQRGQGCFYGQSDVT